MLMFPYVVILGCTLLCAPFLRVFRIESDERWTPETTSLGYWLLGPLLVIYSGANAFVLVLSFVPGNLPALSKPTNSYLPWYTGPVAGLAVLSFGVAWWAWDLYILPRLGYHVSINPNESMVDEVHGTTTTVMSIQVRFHPSPRLKSHS